jgi:hypothetical protein
VQFRSESFIAHPVQEVFRTYRDRLPEVVPYLDDISAVNVLKRDEKGGLVELHNEWVSQREIPKAAAAILKPEHLRWDDYATWDESKLACTFEIRTRAFRDAVRVTGGDTFEAVPGGTKVILSGDFHLDIQAIPGVPSFLAKTLLPQVEKFIVGLIQPNLEQVNRAIGRFLDAQG